MAKKSKLLAALDAHQGRDSKKEHQKKKQKQAERRKKSKPGDDLSESRGEAAVGAKVHNTSAQTDAESEGWETDESEAALTAVGEVLFHEGRVVVDGLYFRLTPHALMTATVIVKRV